MHSQDISFSTPQENILYDEVLLYLAETEHQGEMLRFWESQKYFIVLGRVGKLEEDILGDQVRQDHIPVLRRYSGGGTVIQGRGCLNYSMILSQKNRSQIHDLRGSYEYILGKVRMVLKSLDIDCEFRPISDIALADSEKKISGNAQHRGRNFILHHGTILYGFDLYLIERYLKIPRHVPDYRRGRSHGDFLANIAVKPADFKNALTAAFEVKKETHHLSQFQRRCLDEFLQSKKPVISL